MMGGMIDETICEASGWMGAGMSCRRQQFVVSNLDSDLDSDLVMSPGESFHGW
jgi:hypothetical protein